MESLEIKAYLLEHGFNTKHLLDAWKENENIYYISGIYDITGTQTMTQIDPHANRYRNKGMRAGSVWTSWQPVL